MPETGDASFYTDDKDRLRVIDPNKKGKGASPGQLGKTAQERAAEDAQDDRCGECGSEMDSNDDSIRE